VIIKLRLSHALLFVILFVVEFWGLWFSVHHALYLQDFVQHTTVATLTLWLAYFSLGSAFLTTVLIAKFFDALSR
jgi:hypothetical protein